MIKVNRFYNFDLRGMEQYFHEQALKGYKIVKMSEEYFTFKKVPPKNSYYHFVTKQECEGKLIFKTPQLSLYETQEQLETITLTKWGYDGSHFAFIVISSLFVLFQLIGPKFPYFDEAIRPIMLGIACVLLFISVIDVYLLKKNKKDYVMHQTSTPTYRFGLALLLLIYFFVIALLLNSRLVLPLFLIVFYYIPWNKGKVVVSIAFALFSLLPMWMEIPPYLGTPIQTYVNFEVDHRVYDSTYGYFLSTESYYAYSHTRDESFVFEYYNARDVHVLEETIKKHQTVFTSIDSKFDACFKEEVEGKVNYNIIHNNKFLNVATTSNNDQGALDFAYEKLGVDND